MPTKTTKKNSHVKDETAINIIGILVNYPIISLNCAIKLFMAKPISSKTCPGWYDKCTRDHSLWGNCRLQPVLFEDANCLFFGASQNRLIESRLAFDRRSNECNRSRWSVTRQRQLTIDLDCIVIGFDAWWILYGDLYACFMYRNVCVSVTSTSFIFLWLLSVL